MSGLLFPSSRESAMMIASALEYKLPLLLLRSILMTGIKYTLKYILHWAFSFLSLHPSFFFILLLACFFLLFVATNWKQSNCKLNLLLTLERTENFQKSIKSCLIALSQLHSLFIVRQRKNFWSENEGNEIELNFNESFR